MQELYILVVLLKIALFALLLRGVLHLYRKKVLNIYFFNAHR
jgi:hypothetical protein